MFNIRSDIAAVSATVLILILAKRYIGCIYVDKIGGAEGRPYPPGPEPWPVIGNMYNIPTANSWLTYTKWRKIFGNCTLLNYWELVNVHYR